MAEGKKGEPIDVPKIPTSAELLKLAQEQAAKEKALKQEPPKKR